MVIVGFVGVPEKVTEVITRAAPSVLVAAGETAPPNAMQITPTSDNTQRTFTVVPSSSKSIGRSSQPCARPARSSRNAPISDAATEGRLKADAEATQQCPRRRPDQRRRGDVGPRR